MVDLSGLRAVISPPSSGGEEMFLHVISLSRKGLPPAEVVKLSLDHVSRLFGGSVPQHSGTFHRGAYFWHKTPLFNVKPFEMKGEKVRVLVVQKYFVMEISNAPGASPEALKKWTESSYKGARVLQVAPIDGKEFCFRVITRGLKQTPRSHTFVLGDVISNIRWMEIGGGRSLYEINRLRARKAAKEAATNPTPQAQKNEDKSEGRAVGDPPSSPPEEVEEEAAQMPEKPEGDQMDTSPDSQPEGEKGEGEESSSQEPTAQTTSENKVENPQIPVENITNTDEAVATPPNTPESQEETTQEPTPTEAALEDPACTSNAQPSTPKPVLLGTQKRAARPTPPPSDSPVTPVSKLWGEPETTPMGGKRGSRRKPRRRSRRTQSASPITKTLADFLTSPNTTAEADSLAFPSTITVADFLAAISRIRQ